MGNVAKFMKGVRQMLDVFWKWLESAKVMENEYENRPTGILTGGYKLVQGGL